MRVTVQFFVGLCLFVALGQGLFGQSLGDVARRDRQRAGRDKQAKVYTNEDIPQSGEVTTTSTPGADKEKTEASSDKPKADQPKPDTKSDTKDEKAENTAAKPDGKSTEAAKPAQSPEEKQAALEKEYRQKFGKLRDELALQESKADVMQRELNLQQQQYYSDPNVALREQTFRGDIDRRTQELQQQKANVDKAKQAIADLEEELQKKGLPPGWAR